MSIGVNWLGPRNRTVRNTCPLYWDPGPPQVRLKIPTCFRDPLKPIKVTPWSPKGAKMMAQSLPNEPFWSSFSELFPKTAHMRSAHACAVQTLFPACLFDSLSANMLSGRRFQKRAHTRCPKLSPISQKCAQSEPTGLPNRLQNDTQIITKSSQVGSWRQPCSPRPSKVAVASKNTSK